MKKSLGKIRKITLGSGGYYDGMFGISIELSMDGGSTGVGDFKGWWSRYPKGAKYPEEEWTAAHTAAYAWLRQLMTDAKVNEFRQLEGVPVEVEFESNTLKSWRVLTEVL